MAKNAKQQAAIAMSMKAAGKKPKMAKGGAAGTALKNALIKAGYKKGGSTVNVKKYQTAGEVKNPSRTPGTRVEATPVRTTTWVVNNPSDTAAVRYGDSKLTVNDKGQPKRYSKRKLGGSTNKKK